MPKNELCKTCHAECQGSCPAYEKLIEIYNEQRTEEKRELIKELRKQLDIIDWEPSGELEELGNKVLDKIKELDYIRDYEIKIGYVLSYEAKTKDGKTVFADCRKVNSSYLAYLPYDFLITFYEPNISILSDNQKKIVMWHELRHVSIGPKGLKVAPHEVDDFKSILREFGIDWNEFDQEVPDILGGGESEKESGKKEKSKRR
jgi:predicted metallopeptidase